MLAKFYFEVPNFVTKYLSLLHILEEVLVAPGCDGAVVELTHDRLHRCNEVAVHYCSVVGVHLRGQCLVGGLGARLLLGLQLLRLVRDGLL